MSKRPIHPVEAQATAPFARPRSDRKSWAALPGGASELAQRRKPEKS